MKRKLNLRAPSRGGKKVEEFNVESESERNGKRKKETEKETEREREKGGNTIRQQIPS